VKLPTFALDARLFEGTSTGDSTYWTGLINGLIQTQPQVQPQARILLYSNKPKPKTIPVAGNFEWIHLPARSSRLWSMVQFPLAARRAGATAIHTQYSISPLVGKVGITTVHDVSFFIGPEWFGAKDRLILTRSVPAAVKRARTVIAVSQTDRTEIERYIPAAEGKVRVTYNACPPWIVRRDRDQARASVRSRFGLDEPYLLTIGTKWPRKNMELAVDAVNGLSSKIPHRLVLTGKGDWGGAGLGTRALTTGYVANEDLCDLYSAADLYLAPSRHEGFGIPLLEAFRCGCPVLCSSGGALPEVAGTAAEVEPSWRAEDWTTCIEALLSDSSKLQALSARGIEREREFDWTKTARKTMDIYLGKDGD
jgi:glycosyltransferase involved in cell wall biosynthesis